MESAFVKSPKDPKFKQCIIRLRVLKEKRKTLTDSRQQHVCDPNLCAPESEASLQAPNPIACNIFMCRYGSVHLCTEDHCKLYGGVPGNICPVSGLQHSSIDASSYDKHKPHTWYRQQEERRSNIQTMTARFLLTGNDDEIMVKEERLTVIREEVVKRKKRTAYTKQISEEEANTEAGRIVKLLLYSPERRIFIEKCIQRNLQLGEEAKAQYVRQQLYEEHQLPYACDMYLYKAYQSSRPLPLKEFAFDPDLHRYYVFVIMQVWQMVQRFHVPRNQKQYDEDHIEIVPRLNFPAIALATLYLMRKGHRQNNIQLLPADDFLLLNLPHVNIYGEFGLEKSLVTIGDKLITGAYENALQDNTPIADIVLDLEKMPIKETHKIIETDRGLVKLSSNGEQLFMPSSRKKIRK